tara:strand:+ start:1361 stop:1840 length:480 start_codon:yes stop_codon:yes gene_type:complete
MEKLNFFFVKRRYITFIALKDYICEDLIIKIIENNTGGTKILYNLNNLNMELKNYLYFYYLFINKNRIIRPIPSCLLFLLSDKNKEYSKSRELYSRIDIFRSLYLKGKMSENKGIYYSKHYKTWIRFQYYLIKTKCAFEDCSTYGFQNIKKFSDVLYKD